MPKIELIDAYVFDAQGYFNGVSMCQVVDGQHVMPPSSTLLCPWGESTPDATVFYKFTNGGWSAEKKPACASDLIGIVVAHESMTQHDIELRSLIQRLSDSEGYRQLRGDDLSWSIEKIPEKTKDELRKEAEEYVRAKRDNQLARTDFILMQDYPASEAQKREVTKYRQALRDIPQQAGFPENIEWPTAPAVLTKRA